MKVLNLVNIIAIIILSSLSMLKAANGFYTGFSYGVTVDNKVSFKLKNINYQKKYSSDWSRNNFDGDGFMVSDDTFGSYSVEDRYSFISQNDYISILKNINFDTKASNIFIAFVGYSYKKLKIEAEVKSFSLKFKPKQYVYNTVLNHNYNNRYAYKCSSSGLYYGLFCQGGETDLDGWHSFYESGTNTSYINNVTIDPNSTNNNTVFSTDIDRELFTTSNKTLNSNNYLGFINILLEEPVYNGLSLFVGAGFGYGQTYFSKYEGVLNKVTSANYPVYQYKIGAAYNVYGGLDVVLSYANINMLNVGKKLKNTPIEITDTKLQTIDVGIRYNFFSNKSVSSNESTGLFGASES